MNNTFIGILVGVVSLFVTTIMYPLVLNFAKRYNIVDNPNARKLQRIPIPVMGGVAVYFGILVGCLLLNSFIQSEFLLYGLLGMTIMMMIGVWDDVKDLSPLFRFLIEISLVGAFMALTGVYIDDFHGLWGIHDLEPWLAIPLSIVSGVGIINAVNLIDGVDGYASGYGIFACICFGTCFWSVWSPLMVSLTLIVIGALLPFFMHNVFGIRSKMFMGDGGTLMLGMVMTMFVFFSMSSIQRCDQLEDNNISLSAFSIAVLCIPIGDTLRVMMMRILRGRSPFSPDKTHLHHLFIDMGFSHLGAALFILLINLMVVLSWLLSWHLGASIDMQFYIVVGLGLLVTFGFYRFMKYQQGGGPVDEEGYPLGTALWHAMCKLGAHTRREDRRSWRMMRYLVDGPVFGRIIRK